MIRTVKVLYCDNEHGFGNVTFPELERLDPMKDISAVQLRREARAAGWVRTGGADYCDLCADSVLGRGEYA